MSPDVPFVRREGQDQLTAIHNRVAALKRIQHLCGVDLTQKSAKYKMLVDAEMYSRFYQDYPTNHPIDEEFCQNAAIIVKEIESKDKKELEVIEEGAEDRVKQLFKESQVKPSIPSASSSNSTTVVMQSKRSILDAVISFFSPKRKETHGIGTGRT